MSTPGEMVDVTVWVLVDENGRAVADCDPQNLGDEYRCDVGDLHPHTVTQLYRLTFQVPRPVPISFAVAVPTVAAVPGPVAL